MTLDKVEQGGQPPCVTPEIGKTQFKKDKIGVFA